LVLANLMGHDSHGVGMIPAYVRHLQAGLVVPNTRAKVVKDDGAVLMFDGQGRAYVSELWWQPGQTSPRYGPAGADKGGRVSVYDRDGHVIGRWGGTDPAAVGDFAAPHGIAIDSRRDVYVSEVTWTFAESRGHVPAGTHTFQKFALKDA